MLTTSFKAAECGACKARIRYSDREAVVRGFRLCPKCGGKVPLKPQAA